MLVSFATAATGVTVILLPAAASFLGQLAALLALVMTAYALGRWLAWDIAWSKPLERLVVASALGLAALGYLGFLLGLMGQLARGPLIASLLAIHLLAWRAWRELGADLRALVRWIPGWVSRRRLAMVAAVTTLAMAAALAPLLLLALYTPTAFDATLYHLPFARAFAGTGRLPWLPDLRFPVFPQLSEVLFAEMMLLAGDVASQLVELLATLLTAALLLAWGRAARSPEGTTAGVLAAAAWLGNPLVIHLAGTAYVEPGLALFATASLYSLWRWQRGAGRGWLALAAAFAAAAASTKYLGLLCLGIGACAALFGRRRPVRRIAADVGVFAVVALALLAPWYGRILFYTGNPVFPFLPGVFGDSPWRPYGSQGLLADPGSALAGWGGTWPARLGNALGRLVTLPWDWTFRRAAAGNQPPVSPAYLFALPVLVWGAVRDRLIRGLLLLSLAWAALFLALPVDVRYLLPALALLSLALGIALDRLVGLLALVTEPARLRLLAAAALVLFLPGWLYACHRLARQGPPPATAAARERYLAAELTLYPAVRHLNRTHGSRYRAYGIFAEQMKYFARGELLGDWSGPGSFDEVAPLTVDPARLHRRLRKLRADHLLIRRVPLERGGVGLADTPAARRLFRLEYADAAAQVYALR